MSDDLDEVIVYLLAVILRNQVEQQIQEQRPITLVARPPPVRVARPPNVIYVPDRSNTQQAKKRL